MQSDVDGMIGERRQAGHGVIDRKRVDSERAVPLDLPVGDGAVLKGQQWIQRANQVVSNDLGDIVVDERVRQAVEVRDRRQERQDYRGMRSARSV
ncbi:MAG: hypothetical protein ACRD26_13075 [Vicinamibacterales bacterium]